MTTTLSQDLQSQSEYNFEIGTGQPGTPLFTVKLTLESSNNPNKGFVEGAGEINSNVKPPADPTIIKTNLEGTYTITRQQVVIHDVHPIITEFKLIGVPPIQLPKPGEQLPIIRPNVILTITIDATGFGTTGTATYEYRTDPEQPWQTVKDVPVKIDRDEKA